MRQFKLYSYIFLFFVFPLLLHAEENPFWQEPTKVQADSLKQLLISSKNDTIRMLTNRQLGLYYQEISRPIALAHFEELLKLARQLKQKLWEAEGLSRIGYVSGLMQNYSTGLKSLLLAKEIASDDRIQKDIWNVNLFSGERDPHLARLKVLANINEHLGLLYYFTGDYNMSLEYHNKCLSLNEKLKDDAFLSLIHQNIGESYIGLKQFEMAIPSLKKALFYSLKSGYAKYRGLIYLDIGRIKEDNLNYADAKKYYHTCVQTSTQLESTDYVGMAYLALADLERKTGAIDSSLIFAENAVNIYRFMNDSVGLADAYLAFSSAFDLINLTDSAYFYLKKGITLKTILNKEQHVNKFQTIGFDEQIRLQALEAKQMRTQSRTRTFALVSGIIVLLLIIFIFHRNNKRQKKDKAQIEKAYSELKSTQSQLIQSEKMASLGELTAGIAHEIQNPLNFVNNFSEVSNELIVEVEEERAKNPESRDENQVSEILSDIKQNLEKINHHGKRAADIVKGMLQHSRTSSGVKEPTDINALADEYLRLAYHGLRAKDKSFNADFKTDFDETLPKINVIPQDIGRVLLNLINNAFYAVQAPPPPEGGIKEPNYVHKPTVIVKTSYLPPSGGTRGACLVGVSDNGPGIPAHIVDKIFQPFFTTKPTGQGTGLGLSLSYDIVKAHGGELKVETKPANAGSDGEGEGSEFIIQIPIY